MPLGSLGRWLLEGTSTAFPVGELALATVTTPGSGLVAAAVTTVLALPVAWLAVRHPGLLSRVLERTSWVGNALPGIVVALALVTVSIRLGARPMYQTTPLLLAALRDPVPAARDRGVRAALVRVPPELEDVARGLGRARSRCSRG